MEPFLSTSRCGKHPSRGWKISRICAIFPSPIFSLWKESLYTRLREKSGSEGGGEGLHAVFRHRDDVNCGERFGRKWFMPRYPRGRGGANRLTSDTHENKSWRFEFFKKRWSSVRWSTLSPREFNRNLGVCAEGETSFPLSGPSNLLLLFPLCVCCTFDADEIVI